MKSEVLFTDTNSKVEYRLNVNHKVIKNLTGDNFIVKSNEDALVYFYKKIPADSTNLIKEFDKTKLAKNMIFTIDRKDRKKVEITIIRDFGFKECYPIISEKNWEVKNSNFFEITTENLYDKLENILYEEEGEKYFVYAFDSLNKDNLPIFNSDKYEISENNYIDSLFTKGNKYNFEVFPPNKEGEEGFYLLYSKNKPDITYQFFICENDEIKYSIVNDRGDLEEENTINKDYIFTQKLGENEILKHKIYSDKQSLFAYHFHNPEERYIKDNISKDYSILSINKLDKNSLLIKFSPVYTGNLTQYYIIAAKKDNSNNKDTFSNPCYLAKLMTQNSDKIIVKSIFEKPQISLLAASIDINKLDLNENDEIVIDIISNNINSKNEVLTFYKPIEFNDEQNEYLSFNFDEKTKFDFDKRSKFKYDFINKNNSTDYLILRFESDIGFIFLYTDGIKTEMKEFRESNNNKFEIALSKSGTYFIEFYNEDVDEDEFKAYFTAHILKGLDIIDLSEKSYYNLGQLYSNEMKDPKIYKVQNIKENKNVIFNYEMIDDDGDNFFRRPFEICNDNTGDCEDHIVIYKFEKRYNYTIFIKYIENKDYNTEDHLFIFPAYIITPLDENSIVNIEEGYHFFSEQKILVLDLEKKGQLYAYLINNAIYHYGYSNESINIDNVNSLDLDYEYDDELETFYYDEYDEDRKYGILIPMLKINNYKGQVIISNMIVEDIDNTIIIPAKKNALIIPDDYFFEDEEDINPVGYNLLITYSTTLNNIKYLGFFDLPEYSNIIPQNYLKIPIYVDKNEKNNRINVKAYNPRFSYFGVIDNNAFKVYRDYLQYKVNEKYKISLKDLAPFTIRVYSDLINFDEFINIYLSEIKEKVNIYIKKLYGPTELYECEADPIDKMDFSILAKPLSSCKNKKSIFNRLINLGDTKIFSGYLEHDSYFEGYLDFDDDDRNIKLSSAYKLIKRNVKNMAKYLKRDIVYKLNIDSNYLAKLDVTFDEEVIIYKDSDNILLTLNSTKLTGKLEKGKFKIKANKDVMIYFYGELHEEIKQEKIENVEDAYIEITATDDVKYVIDFGFEGYGPMNLFFNRLYEDDTLFYENLYEKLQTKLIEGESLYFYYTDSDRAKINIKYTYKNLLNNRKNEYTFYSISKSDKNRPLIIHNTEYDDIQYRINFCTTTSEVKMYYQYHSDSSEEIQYFNEEETYYKDDADEDMIKLRFESNVNFVFSYSFYDRTDRKIRNCDTCQDERIEFDSSELIIKDITKTENPNIYSIRFKPNYKYSSTRYIIVISKKDEYSNDIFSNLCEITKLVTNKEEGVKIINIYDSGESKGEYINTNIDISDILLPKTEYIVGIISQELRFEKKLNCYRPKTFSNDIEAIKMTIGAEQEFDLDNDKVYFDLSITKNPTKKEILLLNYKIDQQSYPTIQIYDPNGNFETFNINKQEGYLYFLYDKKGSYKILFTNPKFNNLRESNNEIKGNFTILSTESPFNLDIKKDNIEFEELNIETDEPPSLKFNIKNLDNDYTKKIMIANIDYTKINQIVSVKKDKEENKNLNFNYYTFEKKSDYTVTVKFNKKYDNKYTLEKFSILDFSSNNIEQITSGNKKLDNDKFLIINWSNIKSIGISKINKEAEFLMSNITKSQSKNLVKEFQNIKFNKLTDLNITKPEKVDYSVLMIEISELGTEINIDIDKKGADNDDDDDDGGLSSTYIILISVGGLIVLIAIIFVIIRCHKKRQNIDFNKKAQEITQEKLLDEM